MISLTDIEQSFDVATTMLDVDGNRMHRLPLTTYYRKGGEIMGTDSNPPMDEVDGEVGTDAEDEEIDDEDDEEALEEEELLEDQSTDITPGKHPNDHDGDGTPEH
jgi:Ran GTPase-activating protein (RanGAP) involved in mRNA processing and transport